jgi:regulator of replication initiation timing
MKILRNSTWNLLMQGLESLDEDKRFLKKRVDQLLESVKKLQRDVNHLVIENIELREENERLQHYNNYKSDDYDIIDIITCNE